MDLHPYCPSIGLCGMVYSENALCPIPYDKRNGSPAWRFDRNGQTSQTHIFVSGICHLDSQPRGHRQPGRSSHCHCHRRPGSRILDVDHCPVRGFQFVCRIYLGTAIQRKRKRFFRRRTCLLHAERFETAVDGQPVCDTHHHYLWFCLQFGAKQYIMCSV